MVDFSEYVYYDESSPSCLRYKKNRVAARVGEPCGCLYAKKNMWFISINNKTYLGHRIVAKLHYPDLDDKDTVWIPDNDYSNPTIDKIHVFKWDYKLKCRDLVKNAPIEDLMYYENGKLYWKIHRFASKNLHVLCNEIGDEVKCASDNDGYLIFKIRDRYTFNYKAHRICYELTKGKIPEGYHIDHLDGDPKNNLSENLRAVTPDVNSRNQKLSSRNTSGIIGVRYHDKDNAYKTHWRDENGTPKGRSFSCNRLGHDEALRMAIECRDSAIAEVNTKLEEKGYTERHGTKMEDNDG